MASNPRKYEVTMPMLKTVCQVRDNRHISCLKFVQRPALPADRAGPPIRGRCRPRRRRTRSRSRRSRPNRSHAPNSPRSIRRNPCGSCRRRPFGVGGAHDVAVGGDGVLALEHLGDDRAGDHEARPARRRTAAPCGRRRSLGLGLGELQALLRDDHEALLLEPRVDLAGEVTPGRVRLDDRQGALDGHEKYPFQLWIGAPLAPRELRGV